MTIARSSRWLGELTSLLVRVAMRHPHDPTIVALATLGSAPARPGVQESPFLFDIDVWKEGSGPADASVWGVLEDLHEYRNDVFFGSLTAATCEELRK